ncbi:hypothetical protein EIP86_009895 [Pleurotus ostreatoroseus]|nr:hypothetical protein EIP86_009895 [Pleurotus ostreatoroseus]
MSSKIKELESALAAARLQLSASTEPSEEIDGREPDNQRSLRCRPYGVGSGTLAMDGEGVSSFHGETAQSEYLSELIPGDGLASVYCPPDIMDLGLPHEVLELFNAFPFGMRKRIHNKSLFVRFLPSAQRALSLTESYYRRHAWIPEPAADQQGGKYYVLACAALSLVPIIAEAMVPTIQAIFLVNSFLHNNNRVSAEESWLLTGLIGRLAFRTVLRQAEDSYATYLADPNKPSGVEASEFDTPDELKILGGVLNGVVKHPTAPQSPTFSLGNVVSSFSDIGAPFSFGDFDFHPSPTLTDDDVTAPINFAEFASIFNPNLNDTQGPDISSTLPTYEDIMNVHCGPDAVINLNPDQSYSSFTQPLQAPGRYNTSSFSTNAAPVGGLEINAGNPTASFSGGSHDELWRSLIGGLGSNGGMGGNTLYEQHLF